MAADQNAAGRRLQEVAAAAALAKEAAAVAEAQVRPLLALLSHFATAAALDNLIKETGGTYMRV